MRKRFTRAGVAGLLVAVVFSCFGCRREVPPASAEAVLAAMCDTLRLAGEETGSTVAIYSRAGDPAGGGYLSDTLFSALFGEAARGLLGCAEHDASLSPAALNDAALCLSVAPTPVELAVLRCSDARASATVAGLCKARLDGLRRAWQGTEQASLVEGGVVTVVDGYVLLIVAPNPDRAAEAARRCIRQGGG